MATTFKKILLFTGGILVNAVRNTKVAGNLNNWGAFLPYIASYFHLLDNSVKSSDLSIVPPIGYIAESLFTVLISYLLVFMSIFNVILIFSTIFCTCMFFSSFLTNAELFSWVYGLSIGSLSSCSFLPSLWIIWNEIPEQKSLTSGILLSGYSFGAVPFSLMFTFIVNPHNTKAETTSDHEKLFTKEVAERVPMTIRWVTIGFLITVYLGLFMLPRRRKVTTEENRETDSMSFKEIIRNKRFWFLFILMYLSMCCQGYAHFYYKVIAIQYINDDFYSAYVGTSAFVLAGIGRSVFGYLFNKIYWKKIMSLVHITETLLMAGMWFTVTDKRLYAFFMVSYHVLSSSFYNNVLILTEEAFPGDKRIISCVCLSFIPAFFTPFFISKVLEPFIGMLGSFLIIALFSLILFFCTVFYKEPETKASLL